MQHALPIAPDAAEVVARLSQHAAAANIGSWGKPPDLCGQLMAEWRRQWRFDCEPSVLELLGLDYGEGTFIEFLDGEYRFHLNHKLTALLQATMVSPQHMPSGGIIWHPKPLGLLFEEHITGVAPLHHSIEVIGHALIGGHQGRVGGKTYFVDPPEASALMKVYAQRASPNDASKLALAILSIHVLGRR